MNNKPEKPTTQMNGNKKFSSLKKIISKVNFNFGVVLIIIAIIYIYSSNKKTTTGNLNADKQLEQQSNQRPKTGELNFK